MVLFSLNPSDAELYIDGSQVDASQPVTLEYGIHQIIAKADGYKSLTQYLRVGQESAGVDVQLDKADSDSEDSTESMCHGSSYILQQFFQLFRNGIYLHRRYDYDLLPRAY